MGIGAVEDEGQADDLGAEEGEGGHAVARLPEVLHQGELGVGIGSEQVAVEGQVVRRGVKVAPGQGLFRSAQIDLGLAMGGGLDVGGEGGGDEIDVVLGLVLAPGHAHPFRAGTCGGGAIRTGAMRGGAYPGGGVGSGALGDGAPAGGQVHLEAKAIKGVLEAWVPAAAAVQDYPLGADKAAGPEALPAHTLRDPLQVAADRAGIAEGHWAGSLPTQPEGLQTTLVAKGLQPRRAGEHPGLKPGVEEEGPVLPVLRQGQGGGHGQGALVRVQARLQVVTDQGLGAQGACSQQQEDQEPAAP